MTFINNKPSSPFSICLIKVPISRAILKAGLSLAFIILSLPFLNSNQTLHKLLKAAGKAAICDTWDYFFSLAVMVVAIFTGLLSGKGDDGSDDAAMDSEEDIDLSHTEIYNARLKQKLSQTELVGDGDVSSMAAMESHTSSSFFTTAHNSSSEIDEDHAKNGEDSCNGAFGTNLNDVNVKAEAFIARFHEQIRLERVESMKRCRK